MATAPSVQGGASTCTGLCCNVARCSECFGVLVSCDSKSQGSFYNSHGDLEWAYSGEKSVGLCKQACLFVHGYFFLDFPMSCPDGKTFLEAV